MNNTTCLVCSLPLETGNNYHSKCSKRFFGTPTPPVLDITIKNLRDYAAQSVLNRITVTGVQKKLSLGMQNDGNISRLTIVGLWGQYILKPPTDEYLFLPENEDTVMRIASLARIPVIPHAMIYLQSGELSYIAKRIDRDKHGIKTAMEDFCQISERLTEDKYKGSCEKIGKLLQLHSTYPGLDVVDFFERIVFNYLIGNSDMHLKNYSLIETISGMRLSPAYDLLSTKLAMPEDNEESALTINGKKSRLRCSDFISLAKYLSISERVYLKIFNKFRNLSSKMFTVIDNGRLPGDMKIQLKELIKTRISIFSDSAE